MMYDNSGYLSHHGIKGQKWGVRRFQNEDGTLTAEGKERYQQEANDAREKAKTRSPNETTSRKVRDKIFPFMGKESIGALLSLAHPALGGAYNFAWDVDLARDTVANVRAFAK